MIGSITSRICRMLLLASVPLLWACQSEPTGPVVSKTPVSIRGWLVAPPADQRILRLTDTAGGDAAHRARIFEQTSISVEGFPLASGGMAGNGSFIILDVPPGEVILNFQPPEGSDAQLRLEGVPPNSDVLLPALEIRGNEVVPTDPNNVVVRIPAQVEPRRSVDANVRVAGHPVQAFEVPLSEMVDRREFPEPQ